ncbi:hypothetical protein AVEN_165977-1 [Araneus ventricosus]|uniref:Uncharacterized protein n=1 Tax=Araneus ventricosus TaxID=182803 RepID=A0A4Y2IHC4_ARAVE|nr:hypothetical protein AVEN_165977-1 [Araneus ventricosus]
MKDFRANMSALVFNDWILMVIYLLKRTYQRYRLRHGIGRGRTQSSVMMHPVSVTQVSSMVETQTSQVGLHYRTRNGDRPRDIANSVSEGNALIEDVAVIGRGGLVVESRLWDRRVSGPRPDSTEDPPCIGPAAGQIIRSVQTPSRWCCVEAWSRDASPGVVLVI